MLHDAPARQSHPGRTLRALLAATIGSTLVALSALAGISPATADAEGAADPALTSAMSSITTGFSHACGIDLDGAAWCWGLGTSGQLGNGSNTDQREPVAVTGNHTFTALAAGFRRTCGIDDTGGAWCWGNGVAQPVAVAASHTFTAIALGQDHTCGIDETGNAWCWGEGEYGQLGNGATDDHATPVPVADGHTFTAISAGGGHTCGIDETGIAWCWGEDSLGQLGDNDATSGQSAPVPVAGARTFTAIAAGPVHTCAVDDSGAAWCWGYADGGQLGDGATDERHEPVAVSGNHTFIAIAAGRAHSCGIDDTGTVWCWGSDNVGQAGSGDTPDLKLHPAQVSTDDTFTAISTGDETTCGIVEDGTASCWGAWRFGYPGPGVGHVFDHTPHEVSGGHLYDYAATYVVTVTASSGSSTYGATPGPVTATYDGLLNGETAADLDTEATCTTTATGSVGDYATTCTGAADDNYTFTYVDGTHQITPVAATVTASSGTSTHGATPGPITATYDGLLNGETAADLDTEATCTTTATDTAAVGSYPTSCSGAADDNYTFTYVAGTHQVTAKATTTAAPGTLPNVGGPHVVLLLAGLGLVAIGGMAINVTRT